MNLNFKHIKIKNFMSLGNIDLDLNNLGYVSISGINNGLGDNAKSNGSGKSSILEAIIWNLTGDTLRGTKDIVNRFTVGGTCVELVFKVDDIEYKIARYKDDEDFGTNLKIFINGIDKSGKGIRDTQKILEELLPDLDTNLLGSVIILGQGLPQKFTNNTPSGRKEILEKLSKSDFMIEDIKEKLSNRKSSLSIELRKVEDTLLELESRKSVYEIELEKSNKELEKLYNDTSCVDYNNEMADLEINISSQESELSLAEKKVNDTNEKLQESRVRYSSLDSELKSKQLDISTKYDRNELVKERYAVGSQISQLEKSISEAKNVKDVCPTCGQKLPDVHKIDTTNLEKEIETLRVEDARLLSAIELSKENESKEINKLQESYKQLKDDLLKEGQSCRQSYDSAVQDRDKISKSVSTLKLQKQKLINDRENFLNNKDRLENVIKEKTDAIKQISDKILYNNVERENIKSRLDVIGKMITIATRDFRGFLLSEIIEFINKRAKEYSQEVFGTDKLDFYLNGNNIEISYCDKSYECLSGGEKQRLDIIIQFAIRDMLVQHLDFSSNLLALDEVFDNLDSIGCQKIIDLISKKLNDIESIFVITHHTEDLVIPCDRELVIVKNEQGVSELQ